MKTPKEYRDEIQEIKRVLNTSRIDRSKYGLVHRLLSDLDDYFMNAEHDKGYSLHLDPANFDEIVKAKEDILLKTIYGYSATDIIILAETLNKTGMSIQEFRSRVDLVKTGFQMGMDHVVSSLKKSIKVTYVTDKEESKDGK